MPSHSEGPGIWLSVWRFLLTHCLYKRAAEVLARLRGCAGSPEPSLLAQAISTKFAWRGPNDLHQNVFSTIQSNKYKAAKENVSDLLTYRLYSFLSQKKETNPGSPKIICALEIACLWASCTCHDIDINILSSTANATLFFPLNFQNW